MDALTIHEAAETTGWSPRMLRYVERVGLVEPARSASGYRLYGPAELQRLRTLRELLDEHEIGLSDLAFALRLRSDAALRPRPTPGWRPRPSVPPTCPPPTGCASSRRSTSAAAAAANYPRPWRPHDRHRHRRPTTRSPTSSLAAFGRKEIQLAEHEMPGLMATARASTPTRSRSRARASPARCT